MRQLKLALALPLIHFIGFLAIFGWTLFPYREPNGVIRLWFALNGPVLVLLDACKWVTTLSWVTPHIWTGVRPIYFVFLAGGLALWFSVGRLLDKLRYPVSKDFSEKKLSTATLVLNVLVIICGIRLIFHGLGWFFPLYQGQTLSALSIVNGALILGWALVLIALPGVKLLTGLRRKTLTTPPSGSETGQDARSKQKQ
jgi:hypothetical protein